MEVELLRDISHLGFSEVSRGSSEFTPLRDSWLLVGLMLGRISLMWLNRKVSLRPICLPDCQPDHRLENDVSCIYTPSLLFSTSMSFLYVPTFTHACMNFCH